MLLGFVSAVGREELGEGEKKGRDEKGQAKEREG